MSFEELWHQPELELPEEESKLCTYARSFQEWGLPLVEHAIHKKDLVSINQAVLMVTHRYFEWRAYVPKIHRNRVNDSGEHVCVFAVYAALYEKLRLAQMQISPPMLFLPPPPAPPSVPPPPAPLEIAGIFIGGGE